MRQVRQRQTKLSPFPFPSPLELAYHDRTSAHVCLAWLANLTYFPYPTGLGVLFGKLQQGVLENRQILTVARLRAEAEDVYGQRLADISPVADKISGGFSRDDGASVRKVGIQRVHLGGAGLPPTQL